jgi:hypothetical protein
MSTILRTEGMIIEAVPQGDRQGQLLALRELEKDGHGGKRQPPPGRESIVGTLPGMRQGPGKGMT